MSFTADQIPTRDGSRPVIHMAATRDQVGTSGRDPLDPHAKIGIAAPA